MNWFYESFVKSKSYDKELKNLAEFRNYIWERKYKWNDENNPDDMWRRMAKAISNNDEEFQKFYWLLKDWKFIPGGRIMYVLGTDRRASNSNCYFIPILADSLEGIFYAMEQMARTMSYGGGVGIDISLLRPQGSSVNNSAETSTGAVSFMNLFSETTGTIAQKGRRGALIITIHAQHPDVFEFIDIKKDLSKVIYANISVRIPDLVMEAYEKDEEIDLWYPDLVRDVSILITLPEKVESVKSLIIGILTELNYHPIFASLLVEHFPIEQRTSKRLSPGDFEIKIKTHKETILLVRKRSDIIEKGSIIILNPSSDEFYNYPNANYFLLWHYHPWNPKLEYIEFRKKRIYKKIKAKELIEKLSKSAWESAEPGVQFWDTMKKYSTSEYNGMQIMGTNPCLAEGTKLWDGDKWVKIEKGGKTFVSWKTGEKEVIRLITNAGYEIICTLDHPIKLANGEFIPAEKTKGKQIAWELPKVYELKSPDEKFVLMGFLFGDGYLCGNKKGVCVKLNPEREPEVANLLTKFGFTREPSGAYYINRNKLPFDSSLLNQKSYEKQIPDWILESERQIVASFLRGLFEANGSCNKQGQISLKTTSSILARQVQVLLAGLGIESWIVSNKPQKVKWSNGEYTSRVSFNLQIAPRNGWKFKQAVGFISAKKAQKIKPRGAEYNRKLKVVDIKPEGIKPVYDFKVINEAKPWKNAQGITVHNCGELPLQGYGACLLGNVNLSYFAKGRIGEAIFDFEELKEVVRLAVIFLDRVLDWGIGRHPLPEQNEQAQLTRRLGLGITGLADALAKLGIRYDSEEAITVIEKIMQTIRDIAYETSAELAKEYGPFPLYDAESHLNQPFLRRIKEENPELFKKIQTYGLRHVSLLTVPPVGTGSIIAGTSSGIEPIFSIKMVRRSLGENFVVYHPLVLQWLIENPDKSEKDLPDYFVTADKIDYSQRVKIQGIIQRYVDSSISSTVNLPSDISPETVLQIYLDAWKFGLKGITVYRDQSRENVISKADKPSKTNNYIKPNPVPNKLNAWKYRVETTLDTLHLNVAYSGSQIQEVFVNISKPGTEIQAFAEAIGRLLSIAFRSNIEPKAIIEQLVNIKAGGIIRDRYFGNIYSVPDAIGKVLLDALENLKTQEEQSQKQVKIINIHQSQEELNLGVDTCPRCGGKLIMRNGCWECPNCGYSKCD